MRILVVLAHPDPASFNHAIAEATIEALQANHHHVWFHDLYQEAFDPFLRKDEFPQNAKFPRHVEQHARELADADGIVVVHPNWWGQPPAVLKGWIDRVFRPGVAYRFDEGDSGEGVPIGLLKAKQAIVFNTSNTPPDREQQAFGDPLETIWKRCVFNLCGVNRVERRTFSVIITSAPEQRRAWLNEVLLTVNECFPHLLADSGCDQPPER